jgi:peptidoglycan/LPS O-acetylase OafA/YrhL
MKQLPALTGLRFIAVVMVFLIHYNTPAYGKYLQAYVYQFYVSLTTFFVLSGFLISYNYGKEVSLKKSFLVKYYANRLGRIVPLYFILVTLTFIVFYFTGEGGDHLFGMYLLNITFIKGLSSWYLFTGIFQAWSLTPEMMFYALFPFMYILAARYNWWWRQAAMFWGMGLLVYLFFYFFPLRGFFQGSHFMVTASFFGRCFEFIVGMKLASLLRKWQEKHELNKVSIAKWPIYTLGGGLLSLIVIGILAIINPHDGAVIYPSGKFFANIVFPVTVAVLMFGLITEASRFSRFLSTPALQLLGKSSYAFFLVHCGVIADWLNDLVKGNMFIFFILVNLVAIALYLWVEEPLSKWIKKRTVKAGSRTL